MTFKDFFETANLQYVTGSDLTSTTILAFMLYSLVFSLYVFLIYRISSRNGFYSLSFGKTLVGMSIITTGIVLAMQGSLVVSLGMVGALSIVRFRNAVKSTLDLLFLFWAISIGIICGTGFVEIALVISVVMTVVLLGLDFIPMSSSTYVLTINGTDDLEEDTLLNAIKPFAKKIKVRTRSSYDGHQELLMELNVKASKELVKAAKETKGVLSATLIYHDGEVRF